MKRYAHFTIHTMRDPQRPYLLHMRFEYDGYVVLSSELKDISEVDAIFEIMDDCGQWDFDDRSYWPSTLPDYQVVADFGSAEALQAWLAQDWSPI